MTVKTLMQRLRPSHFRLPGIFLTVLSLASSPAQQSTPPTPATQPAPPGVPVEKPVEQPKAGEKPTEKPAENAEAEAVKDVEEGFRAIETLTKAMEIIRQNYVDESKVGYDRLIASALRGMLQDLDPHCQYLTPQVFEQLKQTQENTYEGVGITISPKSDQLVIVSVREDGPAARAGMLPGDVLVKIGDILADKMGFVEATRLLKGKPGQKLKLTVFRPSTKETRELEMVREIMRQDSVRDAMILDKSMSGEAKIGYVRILQFNQPTGRELSEALDKLEEQGMQALVLDLRNNPGGLLSSAVEVCGEFLPPDTLVVTTEGRSADHRPPPHKTKDRKRPIREYPLAILMNHSSASGSELTAGALQDLKRAIVVGETSFGKGSVQTILPGDNGAAIRLTTARYFTPSHKTIHEKGVVPNIVATVTPEEELRIAEWRRSHTLGSADPAQLAKLGDRQLERAVTALSGVLVFRAARKPQP